MQNECMFRGASKTRETLVCVPKETRSKHSVIGFLRLFLFRVWVQFYGQCFYCLSPQAEEDEWIGILPTATHTKEDEESEEKVWEEEVKQRWKEGGKSGEEKQKEGDVEVFEEAEEEAVVLRTLSHEEALGTLVKLSHLLY